ncbi:MAG: hypothetical protein RL320_1131 [Pseudomonadota bacterium]
MNARTASGLSLAFLGGGNMAQALLLGLLRKPSEQLNLHSITIIEPNEATRQHILNSASQLTQSTGIELRVTARSDLPGSAPAPDWLVLAVKPQVAQEALQELSASHPTWVSNSVLLSIAAGLTTDKLSSWIGHTRITRSMPNTPALIGRGITGLFAGSSVESERRKEAELLLQSVGEVVWLEEEGQLDAVTALSGSGPAYFFLLAEAMTQAGIALGLSEDNAARLARHTAAGAGLLLAESNESAQTLRTRVTSPGGTTAAALAVFESRAFRGIVQEALTAARDRSQELSK